MQQGLIQHGQACGTAGLVDFDIARSVPAGFVAELRSCYEGVGPITAFAVGSDHHSRAGVRLRGAVDTVLGPSLWVPLLRLQPADFSSRTGEYPVALFPNGLVRRPNRK